MQPISASWWVQAEDGTQASDTEIRMEACPEGHRITYGLGVRIGGVRRGTRLLIRCYEDGRITVAWGRGGEETRS